jgi:hypothetical protein
VRVRVGIAIGLLLIATGLLAVLLKQERPYLGDNEHNVELLAGVVIPGRASACQAGETIPPRTGVMRFSVSTAGRRAGPVEVSVQRGGEAVASGRSAAGIVDQPIDVRLEGAEDGVQDARICVRNAGRVQVAVIGESARSRPAARVSVSSFPQDRAMRWEWYEAEPVTRLARVGDVAERYGLVKASFFGSWTFWVGLAVLLAISAAAVRLVVRELRA